VKEDDRKGVTMRGFYYRFKGGIMYSMSLKVQKQMNMKSTYCFVVDNVGHNVVKEEGVV
jgi:hypothetical protein